MLIWAVLVLLFTFNTVLPSINLGYNLWLIFNILVIFSIVRLIKDKDMLFRIFRLYIISFIAMGIIGILQFLCGVIGIDNVYITQWWVPGVLPRVNGFSFEPSYYFPPLFNRQNLFFFILSDQSLQPLPLIRFEKMQKG